MIKAKENLGPAGSEIVVIADQIRSLCSAVTKIARADLQSRLENHDFGISGIEHGVLRHLSHGISSMAEISRRMGVAPSTLVYVVDELVKKKLVNRSKDPNDRRREPLLLTKEGAGLFAKIPKMEMSSVLVKSLEGMKEPRRRELLELLNEFVGGLPGWEMLCTHSESAATDRHSIASRRKPITSKVKTRRRSHD